VFRINDWKMSISPFLLIGILFLSGTAVYSNEKGGPEKGAGAGTSFLYIARKLGVPILRASIKIENGIFAQENRSIRFGRTLIPSI